MVAVTEGWVVIVLFAEAVPERVIVPLLKVYPVVPKSRPSPTLTAPTVTVPAVPWNTALLVAFQVVPETGEAFADQFMFVVFQVPAPPSAAPSADQYIDAPTGTMAATEP
jgi:hypothetical protein